MLARAEQASITLERQQPLVSFDIRLGKEFELVGVDIDYAIAKMRDRRMSQADINATNIFVSADAPKEENGGTLYGECSLSTNTITTYLGNSLQTVLEANQTALYKKFIGLRTSLRASRNLAHEISHRADVAVLGADYLIVEQNAHEANVNRPLKRGIRVAEVAITAGMFALCLGRQFSMRSFINHELGIRKEYDMYYTSPGEQRARAFEADYAQTLDDDGSETPLLVYALRYGETDTIQQVLINNTWDAPQTTISS